MKKKGPVSEDKAQSFAGTSDVSRPQTALPSYICGANAPHDLSSCLRCAFIRGYMTRAILAYRAEVA